MSESRIFPLRLPPDLRLQLEGAASKEDRTLTMEIIRRLKASFKKREDFKAA
jgi:Arc-like DNA binding domain